MNLNDFAVKIAKMEKGKKQVDIGQIKEIINRIGITLAKEPVEEVMDFLNKHSEENVWEAVKD